MAEECTKALKDPAPAVARAIRDLRRAYRVGTILDRLGPRTKPGNHELRQIAAKHGYDEETGRRLRQFARVYTKDDLDRLCRRCKQHHRALGVSMVIKFITIADPLARREFELQAIRGHWRHIRLERELRHRFQRDRGKRGRKPKLPETRIEALEQVREMSHTFAHFAARLRAERREWLSGRVAGSLQQAVAALQTLEDVAMRALARSRPE